MFFTIPNTLGDSPRDKRRAIIATAYGRVSAVAVPNSAKALNERLKADYGQDLISACKSLIVHKTNISYDPASDSFVVSFIDEESDNLAKLIAFGDGGIRGCRLLEFAFDQRI